MKRNQNNKINQNKYLHLNLCQENSNLSFLNELLINSFNLEKNNKKEHIYKPLYNWDTSYIIVIVLIILMWDLLIAKEPVYSKEGRCLN